MLPYFCSGLTVMICRNRQQQSDYSLSHGNWVWHVLPESCTEVMMVAEAPPLILSYVVYQRRNYNIILSATY